MWGLFTNTLWLLLKSSVRVGLASTVVASVLVACGTVLSTTAPIPAAVTPTTGAKGSGTEGRNWIDGPKAPVTSSVRYQVATSEIFIAARDGVQLGAKMFLPQGLTDGPHPCVLMADGYGHNTPIGMALEGAVADLSSRGYGAIHVSMRGSGNSGGIADLYNRLGQDGYDVVEWMAKQTWCDGRVGMVGASLLGISQWLTAKQSPPHLQAIVPHVACGNCYDYVWYPGGMLPGPGRVARPANEYNSALQHRDFDGFWLDRTTLAEDHLRIAASGIAVLTTGGWNDYISPANLEAFEQMPDNARKKLVWGPDAHGSMLLNPQPYTYYEFEAMWLDRYLRDIHNGIETEAAAVIYVQGPNLWRNESKWPIPDTTRLKLYLNGGKGTPAASLNDGRLLPRRSRATQSSVAIDYAPEAGPFLLTLLSQSKGRYTADQRPEEKSVLTWTSPVLSVPTEVTGHIGFTFWASVHGTDADFVALLTDVAPDGASSQVTVGYLNASHALSREPRTVIQDVATQYTLNIWPTSYVFQAGHRIRLDVAGGAAAGAGLASPQGPGKSPYAAHITIWQDVSHPSVLDLPVIGKNGVPVASGS
jgi:predicted acyl esterase